MALRVGTRLGPYEVIAAIGAGGMGEVYRARDTRLNRDVALKVLPELFALDPDRLARFKREAQVLAALNHPNIAAIHGFEESAHAQALVLELVEGPTLAEKLAEGSRGKSQVSGSRAHRTGALEPETVSPKLDRAPAQGLPLEEALPIARQIAEALDAAHEKGIVHRDLKPANIKITPDATVKVLDFGLAKTFAGDGPGQDLSQFPTVNVDGTVEGVLLGTLAYMSPEQARGRAVDKRTDIWAFGCVVYELLTGRAAFAGETVSDTIATILEREPEWRALPEQTPANVRRLLRRCLEKDPKRRLRDIGDSRLEIDEALSGSVASTEPTSLAAVKGRRLVPAAELVAVGGAMLLLGVTLGLWLSAQPSAPTGPAAQFVVPLPPAQRLAGLDFPAVAISPDGSYVAYVASLGGRGQLFLRPMNSLEAKPIPGTADASSPFFSPDSRWIAFFAGGKLKKVPVAGGAPVPVCDVPIGFGGSWGSGDMIVFAPTNGSGLSQVPAAGGTPTRVTALNAQKGEFSHRWPELLPGGDAVLFTAGTVGSWEDAQIVAHSIESGRRQVLIQGGTYPRYLSTRSAGSGSTVSSVEPSTGHLLYAHGGGLFAVPFDAARLSLTGPPVRVLDNVLQSSDGAAQVSLSRSGTMLFVPSGLDSAERRLIGVDRAGRTARLAAPPRAYSTPRFSPDGRKLLMTIRGATDEIWVYDMAEDTLRQLTFEADNSSPVWTRDGERVAFSSNRAGPPNLFWMRADGSGAEQRLASNETPQFPGSWTPDGQVLAYVARDLTRGRDIWMLPTVGDRKPRAFLQTEFDESAPRVSPDGRWIAYVSNESGQNEVYVAAYSDSSRKRQVSKGGGAEPVWAPSGRELFYRAGDRMMAVAVDAGAEFRVADPRVMFEASFEKGTLDAANYDVAPDGQRFVLVKATEPEAARHELRLLFNWFEALVSGASPRP